MIRLLFIGDIVGRPGREIVRRGLAAIVAHRRIDLVIANVENAAAGFGVTPDIADDLLERGVHVMTGGNHIWDKKEILPYIDRQPRLLRPANFPAGAPGRGICVAQTASGVPVARDQRHGPRLHESTIDDPFRIGRGGDRGARRRGARHLRGLPRRGDVREGRDGLAPRRPRHRGRRHAHPRADGRRPRPAPRHGLHHATSA